MAEEMLLQIPLKNDTSRKIIHLDMDAFYASIEEREHPEFKTQPLIIARDPRETGGKGVVTTANYHARKFGVHAAMPAQQAKQLIPDGIFKAPDFNLYRAVSAEIHEIFHRYTDKIEPIAFDEAYLDVTENKQQYTSTVALAQALQHEIFKKTKLTSSTGISYNKLLAKMASDYRKPVGRTIILEEQAMLFLARLPIEKFQGVGKKTAEKMHALGIYTGADLQAQKEIPLMQEFGKMGYLLFRRVRGIDNREVAYLRQRKSVSNERTYNPPLVNEAQVRRELSKLSEMVMTRLGKIQLQGKTIILKVRDAKFETLTKRATLENYPANAKELYTEAYKLWQQAGQLEQGVRLLGVGVTTLLPKSFENVSLSLDWQS